MIRKVFAVIFALVILALTLPISTQAADPLLVPLDKQPIDAQVLAALSKAGVDKNYVRLSQDYGRKVDGKSPYARIWSDAKSNTKIAEISQLPMVDADGKAIIAGWNQVGAPSIFTAKNNLFTATINNLNTTLTVKNDQVGKNKNDTLTFTPTLYVGGFIRAPTSDKATLLAVDPLNPNYKENTLEWYYSGGIIRRIRLIEGSFQGSWVFGSNPGAGAIFQYNQTGAFRLSLGQYKFSDDIESVPASVFASATYPFTIQDSVTFYPDADPETNSVDGYTQQYQNTDWATLRAAVGNGYADNNITLNPDMAVEIQSNAAANNWQTLRRSIYLFDTSSIPTAANITAATFSLYGDNKTDALGITPGVNIYSSAPAANNALAAGDFDSLGTTPFSTNITYSAWSVSGYNDFVLNVTGIATIDKDGITKLGMRINYDAENIEPPSASPGSGRSGVSAYYAERGAGYQPKLVITYGNIASVTTQSASSITNTTATGSGNVTDAGGANVTARGGQWTLVSGNYTGAANVTESGSFGTGTFTFSMTSLNPGSTYYYRAMAQDFLGWGYGNEVTFYTLPSAPTGFTLNSRASTALDVYWTKGTGSENTTIRYRASPNVPSSPTDGASGYSGTGSSTNITGLGAGTSYYMRAWAWDTNSGYSTNPASPSDYIFWTTLPGDPSNLVATAVSGTQINLTWTIGDNAQYEPFTIVKRKTGSYPTDYTDGTTVYNLSGSSVSDTGLSSNTTYYYRAWSRLVTVYGEGTLYSSGYSQATTATWSAPALTTQAVSNIQPTTATGSGNITWTGGENADIRGIVWNTTGTPTISDNKTQEAGSFGAGTFTESITGLTHSTLYYVRAFAHNSLGYSYGNEVTFTSANTIPTLTTQAATSTNITSAVGNGTITDTGGDNATSRGIQWGTVTGSYTANVTDAGNFGTGAFTDNMTGLIFATTYYYRAFAINPSGIGYGNEVAFSTLPPILASVVTTGASNIQPTSAYLKGTLTSLGSFSSVTVSIDYGTTTSYGSSLSAGELTALGGFTAQATGLSYNTTYHFRAVASYGLYVAYGGDLTFTTAPALGSSTALRVIDAKVFSNFISSGDLLFVAEVQNNYTGLYPNQSPREHFMVQLVAVNNVDILGAAPLTNWGDRPASIYFNPTASANLTQGALYYFKIIGDVASSNATASLQLTASDWRGYDLLYLDEWVKGTAKNMAVSDSVAISSYVTVTTDRNEVITTAASGYFTSGIPSIAQRRPNLFTTSSYQTTITPGTSVNAWDKSDADAAGWRSYLGANFAADIDTMALPLGITGKDFMAGLLALIILGCVMVVVGETGGFGALGAVLISVPILWLGTYFRIMPVAVIVLTCILFGVFSIRQFVVKTL